jgi:hypothetical protein
MSAQRHTYAVSDAVFREVYDSPASLPGRYRWLTREGDVRELEALLGMPPGTIGAPLWVSGDRKRCLKCSREVNWLDIVSSALEQVHDREMVARVILGEQKFVNTEAPQLGIRQGGHAARVAAHGGRGPRPVAGARPRPTPVTSRMPKGEVRCIPISTWQAEVASLHLAGTRRRFSDT